MRQRSIIFGFLVLFLFAAGLQAGNWPHWRGDQGNGVSQDATPPTKWDEKTNVKWKVAIPGRGSGSPVIWEDKVYVVSGVPTTGNGQSQAAAPAEPRRQPGRSRSGRRGRAAGPLPTLAFTLFCFDRATGKELWKQVAVTAKPHAGTHGTNNFASASPCTDGKHVYAHFGSRGLYCYTMQGELKWKRDDLGKMQTRNSFGEGSSPTISGDRIIVPWDHEGQSYLYSLNKLTGKTVWQVKRNEPTCWATPLIMEHAGKQQIVMNGENSARSYDFATGEELWRCGGQTQRPCASAVAANGIVYIGSGFRGSFLGAFRLDGSGDIERTDSVVWTTSRDTPDVASPVLSEGRLYYYKARAGVLSCVDAATGKAHFGATRVPGLREIYASPVAAGGHIYLCDRDGKTVVIKDGESFEVVSTNSLGEAIDATPAPVDNQLFIRGERHLFCISG